MQNVKVQELSNYMNNLFNSPYFQQVVNYQQSLFTVLGNLLTKYYISTHDDSEESIKYLCMAYITCLKEKRNFTEEIYIPYIFKKIREELQLEEPLSLLERVKIAYLLKERNINKFYIHSFPGALYEEVKTNGLDISKELFQQELSLLERTSRTSYKKGVLCYCELSEASLSYATSGMPERVKFALDIKTDNDIDLPKKEYYRKLFQRSITSKIKEGTLKKEVAPSYIDIGLRVLDFYTSSDESCIAIFQTRESKKVIPLEDFINSFMKINLYEISKTTIGAEIIKRLENITDPIKYIEELDLILIELTNTNPLLKEILEIIIDQKLEEIVKHISIPNLEHGGFADGYEIEGGKLSPRDFSLVKFPTPREMKYKQTQPLEITPISLPPKRKNKEILIKNFQGIDKILNTSLSYNNVTRIEILYNKELKKPPNVVMITTTDGIILPNNYLIKQEGDSYIYSCFSEKVLRNKIEYELADKIRTQEKDQISKIVEKYKQTNNYHADYYDQEEDLIEDAIDWYAKISLDNTDPTKLEQIKKRMANSLNTFTLTKRNKETIIISNNQEYIMETDILVDSSSPAPYNDYYYNILQVKQEGLKQ